MEEEEKAYHWDITRGISKPKNNLLELLCITPAKPIPIKSYKNDTCVFVPKCDKYYVPKKRTGFKVRTVRDIRNIFERDNYRFIIEDMEKQQNALLNKIRTGSSAEFTTKNMARKLLNADHPVARTAWQMLNNINPEGNANPTQFVLWNGKRIRVVGSRGGKTKFISNYDLKKRNIEDSKTKSIIEKRRKKLGLLSSSLNIQFKPGPLRRKKNLDVSHQKYHMGPIELVKLPKPALEIQPAYGKIVEPVMLNFLNKLRSEDGTISEKWAEFSVSVLGAVENDNLIQTESKCCVTFDLSYKCSQSRILMRRDVSNIPTNIVTDTTQKYPFQKESNYMNEIKNVMENILDSVEISLTQDLMYSTEKEPHVITSDFPDERDTKIPKEKYKKKYCELGRLAVTVIQLPGVPKMNASKPCRKAYCNLGCVCDSLNGTVKFKQHCGNYDCMFGCKCEISKCKDIELLENASLEIIPGLMKLESEINANLSKEEQKFHQTVVFSGENSILMKPRKRTSKFSKKYAEYYANLRLKNATLPKKILTIVDKKLDCSNIEPWCMVHNLYRCFCKGRFTDSSVDPTPIPSISTVDLTELVDVENIENINDKSKSLRPRIPISRESTEKNTLSETRLVDEYDRGLLHNKSCARVNIYTGRKHHDYFYKIINDRIKTMEENDSTLLDKLERLMNVRMTNKTTIAAIPNSLPVEYLPGKKRKLRNDNLKRNTNHHEILWDKSLLKNDLKTILEKTEGLSKVDLSNNGELKKTMLDEPNIPYEISGDIYKPVNQLAQELTPWITKSYKQYKEQLKNGKSTLERPKKGKIVLHLWDCLLSRYRNRKNIFLTTTKAPFRMYIATDICQPFFKDCINIDSIRFAELHKYPIDVKNLLTNATNKDYFSILGGWDHCWEIIGSVKKSDSMSNDHSCGTNFSNNMSSGNDSDVEQENWSINDEDADKPDTDYVYQNDMNALELEYVERSKWFLMKLENDFTDIFCHKKGFYAEHDKLIRAINLARVTHKTVVINKKTPTDTENIPFGIYALPITSEYYALVGPYEVDEPLGLEIVKSDATVVRKSTKGYWLSTNKVDNIKIIDDPMSFIRKNQTTSKSSMCTINKSEDNVAENGDPSTSEEKVIKEITDKDCAKNNIIKKKQECLNKETSENNIPQSVKPIKIRRTNGFYHLSPNKNSILKSILPSSSKTVKVTYLDTIDSINSNTSDTEIENSEEVGAPTAYVEPETEASHIKIKNLEAPPKVNEKTAMFILKPEEINKKVTDINTHKKCSGEEGKMNLELENFISSPKTNTEVDDDCFVISDEEDDNNTNFAPQQWTDVWIQCSNINNLGWIRAKRNNENLLKINFLGFSPSKLYTESEAIAKINMIMSKKIALPEHVKLKWQVFKARKAPKRSIVKSLLNKNSSSTMIYKNSDAVKRFCSGTKPNNLASTSKANLFEDHLDGIVLYESSELMEEMEQTSRLLDEESDLLINETEKRQLDIIQTLQVPEESKVEMSETLQYLMSMNDKLVDDDD